MKTAEEIIIAKRFFELSASEKEVVSEYASNEEDYEAMRWLLISARNSFAQEKIEPSADLRKGVMAHLQQKQAAPKTVWLNGVGAFLFPTQKRFYQYPAFQIAAVAVLLVSAVAIYNRNPMQPDLAVNDRVTQQPNAVQPIEVPVTLNDSNDQTKSTEEQHLENSNPAVQQQRVIADATNETEAVSYDWNTAAGVADENYYREMSVAEEVKLTPGLNQPDQVVVQDTAVLYNFSTNNGSYNVASTEKMGIGAERKFDTYKKEDGLLKQKNEDSKSRSEQGNLFRSDKDVDLSINETVPAGDATTVIGGTPTTEKTTGEYNVGTTTNTAGNVYYGYTTTKDSSGNGTSSVDDLEEENAATYSISETKMLKKLFFSVK